MGSGLCGFDVVVLSWVLDVLVLVVLVFVCGGVIVLEKVELVYLCDNVVLILVE